MRTDIDWNDIRKRYEATKPFREMPGETTWVDRLYTWEDFIERGRDVAEVLRHSAKTMVGYEDTIVALNPALHELLMEVYGD